jgi:hypothetical protein
MIAEIGEGGVFGIRTSLQLLPNRRMISRVNLEGSLVLGQAEGGAVYNQLAVDQPEKS